MANLQSTTSQTARLSSRLAKAALLCVPFVIIAFQPVREDGYDPEKIGLIAIFAAIIAGSAIVEWFPRLARLKIRSLPDRLRVAFSTSPVAFSTSPVAWLVAAIVAVLIAEILSTLLSLSPSLSFWGEPSRVQGLLSLLLYLILFWQASRLDREERATLIPALLTASIPVCLWQILMAAQGVNRLLLGSSAGNPDFLSSWIVMVLLFCVPQLIAQIPDWPRPLSIRRRLTILYYLLPILLMVASLIIAQGRGALFGLAVGIAFYVLAWALLRHNRRILLGIGALLIVGVVLYGAVAIVIRLPTAFSARLQRTPVMRLFEPYDPVRIQVWNAASGVVYLQSEPVFSISQQGDPLALLRPLVGYGPETVEQLQSRFGDIFGPNVSVNSFHNAIYDALTTQGWLGLLSWIALLEGAVYLGLQNLNFLGTEPHPLQQFALWQAAGAVAGIAILPVVMGGATVASTAPIGGALGAVGGLLAWIGWKGCRATKESTASPGAGEPADKHNLAPLLLAILAVLLAQWTDTQFGFATGSTQPLLWIFLGVLAGTLRLGAKEGSTSPPGPLSVHAEGEPDDHPGLAPLSPTSTGGKGPGNSGASPYFASAFVAGLFTLHSFGPMLRGQFFPMDMGSAQLPILMGAIFAWGVCGGLLHADLRGGVDQALRSLRFWLVVMIVGWGAFLLVKTAILDITGSWLDNAVQYSAKPILPRDLADAIVLLAAHGLILAFAAFGAMWWIARQRPAPSGSISPLKLAALTLCCALTCAFYTISYTSGVLHNVGNSYMRQASAVQATDQVPTIQVGTAALEGASSLIPWNVPLRLHWTSALADSLQLTGSAAEQNATRTQLTGLLGDIFRAEPYFVNTLEWRNFSSIFAQLLH